MVGGVCSGGALPALLKATSAQARSAVLRSSAGPIALFLTQRQRDPAPHPVTGLMTVTGIALHKNIREGNERRCPRGSAVAFANSRHDYTGATHYLTHSVNPFGALP
ncbi:MAG: hypothetical protein ACI9ZF_001890 [Bradyrhizobium sp.]